MHRAVSGRSGCPTPWRHTSTDGPRPPGPRLAETQLEATTVVRAMSGSVRTSRSSRLCAENSETIAPSGYLGVLPPPAGGGPHHRLVIEIADDGYGFDVRAATRGAGSQPNADVYPTFITRPPNSVPP